MSPLFQAMSRPVKTLAVNEMAARARMNTPRLTPTSTAKAAKRDATDGTDASWRQAVVRTLALPLSFLLLGLGFLGIVLGDKRRALHDVIAGTAVIYSWDARAARLRFLSRG
jgi:hypothetical protein